MKKKNLIIGFIALGAIVGGALLMGTDKGKKLKKKLRKRGKDAIGSFKDKMSDYTHSKA